MAARMAGTEESRRVTSPAPDLFSIETPIAGTAELDTVVAGLDQLARSPPLWSTTKWADELTAARAFAGRWQAPALACGWTLLDLWGAHPRAPAARLACLGAGWIVARSGHHVLEADTGAIRVVTRLGSRLRIYRTEPDPGAVLAWELCGAA